MSDTPIDESTKGSDINISDIISRLTQNSSEQSPPPQNSPPQKTSDSGDILSSLMSNPDLIAKIPQLISLVTPLLSGFLGGQKETQKESEAPAVSIATSSAVSSQKLPPKVHSHSDSRAALLCAIKPYLCADRQAAVDYIIKLSRLGEILKTL